MKINMLSRILTFLIVLSPLTAIAQERFLEGEHYRVLDNPIPDEGITLIEFSYFGCKTCYQLAPTVIGWSHESGVPHKVIPAHSGETQLESAQLHHTFAVMGIFPQMYRRGFDIFQDEVSKSYGADRINDYLKIEGVDQEQFWDTYNSQEVIERLNHSEQMTLFAGVIATPTFIVAGKYKVDTNVLDHPETLTEIFDFLIRKAESEFSEQ